MGDVSNILAVFNQEKLDQKAAILDRLTAAGAQDAKYHCGGELIWVSPYYVRERDALELLDVLEKSNRKLPQMLTDELRGFDYHHRKRVSRALLQLSPVA